MGRMRELLVPYLRLLAPGVVMTAGFVLFVELVTHQTIGAAQGKKFSILGMAPDASGPVVWGVAVAAMLAGGLWLRAEGRGFIVRWNALIEDAKARGIVA
jgi:branched-chain amino acid transport system permease protein